MPTKRVPNDEERSLTIQEQQSFYVVKSNDLIQRSRFSMSLQENKLMLFFISKIKPSDTGNEVYSCSIRDYCKVCNINYDSGKNIEDVKKTLKFIADKSVWVKREDGNEVLIRWLNKIRITNENMLEVTFHEDMFPYLYDLQNKYTRYSLDNILLMKTKYGIRLYELLKSYQFLHNEITFSLGELQAKLDAEKYTRYPDFRRFVLEKAIDDINKFSDIQVSYTAAYNGNNRSVNSITFTVQELTGVEGKIRKLQNQMNLTKAPKNSKSSAEEQNPNEENK